MDPPGSGMVPVVDQPITAKPVRARQPHPPDSPLPCVLILGASGELGRALAKAFQENRWQVLGTGHRHPPPCQAALQIDMTQPSEMPRLEAWLKEQTSRIDAVIHCIGTTHDQLIMKMTDAEWNRCLDVNLKSAFRITRLLLPWFTRQREGHFIFITSWAARTGRAGQANYAAAKAGLIGLSQSIAREYASRGVRANCIVPGIFQSAMTVSLPPEALGRMLADAVKPQLTEVNEMARFILHLARMKGVTGQVFQLDGRIGGAW